MGKRFRRHKAGMRLMENDMLFEVLSRLPVKSLLRCKAVSKTWFSLISSPGFIKSHLNRAVSSAADETLIGYVNRCYRYRDYDVDSSFALFQFRSAHHVRKLEFPYRASNRCGVDRPTSIIGSDCGILCVGVYAFHGEDWWPTTDWQMNIYLWNPATKRSKLIPPHSLHRDNSNSTQVALGFGFDHLDFDLKVVRVASCSKTILSKSIPRLETYSVEIYSATRNSWVFIKHDLPDIPFADEFHVCLHGFLFATGKNGTMAFDLNKEAFICDIMLPVSYKVAQIIDFKDSIAVNTCKGLNNKFSLWTLDDEACLRGSGGIKASWTMKFSIDLGVPLDFVVGFFNSVEFLIEPEATLEGELLSYNCENKVCKKVHVNPYFESGSVCKYTESLLSVAGSKPVN